MNENNSINRDREAANLGILDALTPDVTSNVKTITDLWSLARMTKDMEGDPVWDALYQMGCDPEPFENIGYNFDYGNFKMLYIPMRKDNRLVRFALPKLASVGIQSKEKLMESVNTANSLVAESKFALMGDDVWLVHERRLSDNEDYLTMVEHILKNLKSGAELFYNLRNKDLCIL